MPVFKKVFMEFIIQNKQLSSEKNKWKLKGKKGKL